MLRSYAAGDTVIFALPTDTDNPTLIEGYPMLVKDRNRHKAILGALEQKFHDYANETVDDKVGEADKLSDEETAFIASRIKSLRNVFLRGVWVDPAKEQARKEAEKKAAPIDAEDHPVAPKPMAMMTDQTQIIDWMAGLPTEDRNILIAATMSCKRMEALRKQ